DAPPVKLEVDIDVDVLGRDGTVRTLGEVSPVASALARQQFDNQVKQVRVFVRDDLRLDLQRFLTPDDWAKELLASAAQLEENVV
ncbi:MAG: metal-dependent phosphohydrolase, partial [Rubripirellula sp.]